MRPRSSLTPILLLCLFPVIHLSLISRVTPENSNGVGIGVAVAFFFNADLLLCLSLFVLGFTSIRPAARRMGLLALTILPTVLGLLALTNNQPGQVLLALVLYESPLLVILLMGLWLNRQGKLRDTPVK